MNNLLLAIDIYGLSALIALGIILLLVEIFVVPGTTVVGIIGVVSLLIGVWSAYSYFSSSVGHWVLLITTVVCVVLGYFATRANTWNKLSVLSSIQGKVNTFTHDELSVGMEGESVSRLTPGGKGIFNDKFYEVHSVSGFVDEGSPIVIHKISKSKIEIKSKNNDQ